MKYELMTNKNVSIYFIFLGMQMQEISTVIQLQWILKHTSWSNFSHDKCEKKCTYMHTISKPSSNFPELIIIQIHSRQVNWDQILKCFNTLEDCLELLQHGSTLVRHSLFFSKFTIQKLATLKNRLKYAAKQIRHIIYYTFDLRRTDFVWIRKGKSLLTSN